jgi:hypothetical protein
VVVIDRGCCDAPTVASNGPYFKDAER